MLYVKHLSISKNAKWIKGAIFAICYYNEETAQKFKIKCISIDAWYIDF